PASVAAATAGLPPSSPGARARAAGRGPPAVAAEGDHLAYVGRLRLHRRPASVAADWCPRLYGSVGHTTVDGHLRLHRWPRSSPLTGVSPTRLAYYAARWQFTTSPPARLRRRPVVFRSTRLAYYAASVGCLRLHRPAASAAAESGAFRLHGWPIMLAVLASTSSPLFSPFALPIGVSAYTAGLLCCRYGVYDFTAGLAFARRPRFAPYIGYFAITKGNITKLSRHLFYSLYDIFPFSSASLHQLVFH
ncbi:hypothetical protein EE612_003414, partial [Oryza sativa]